KTRHRRVSSAFRVKPVVRIENDLSDKFSVVEVEGLDRPGLLSELTRALADLNLNIGSAHIATFGEKIIDSFYVVDLVGQKITAPGRQQRIIDGLMSVLDPKAKPHTDVWRSPSAKTAQR
ncbi:MAG: ACT domain-containing protein, partial [Pseudomonadota bacterium]